MDKSDTATTADWLTDEMDLRDATETLMRWQRLGPGGFTLYNAYMERCVDTGEDNG